MAARFGRNKKRRARELLEHSEATVAQLRAEARRRMIAFDALTGNLNRRIAKHERNENLVIEALGMYTGYAPPKVNPRVHLDGHAADFVFAAPPHLDPTSASAPDAVLRQRSEHLMHVLKAGAEHDRLRGVIHMHISLGKDHATHYCVSEESLCLLPETQLVELIANEVTPALVSALTTLIKQSRT